MKNTTYLFILFLLFSSMAKAIEISDQPIVINGYVIKGEDTKTISGYPIASYGLNITFDSVIKEVLKEIVVNVDFGEACYRVTRFNGKILENKCDKGKILDDAYIRLFLGKYNEVNVDVIVGKQEISMIKAPTSIFSPTYNIDSLDYAFATKFILDSNEANYLFDKIELFLAENTDNVGDNSNEISSSPCYGVVVDKKILENLNVSITLANLNELKDEKFRSATLEYKSNKVTAYLGHTNYKNNPHFFSVSEYNQLGFKYEVVPYYEIHANYTQAAEQRDVFQVTAPIFIKEVGNKTGFLYVTLTAAHTQYDESISMFTGLEEESSVVLNVYMQFDGPLKRAFKNGKWKPSFLRNL